VIFQKRNFQITEPTNSEESRKPSYFTTILDSWVDGEIKTKANSKGGKSYGTCGKCPQKLFKLTDIRKISLFLIFNMIEQDIIFNQE
jgi:hypothetical protein